MTDRDFIAAVRRRRAFATEEDAQRSTLAVLTRIAGRLSNREQRDLGSVLPPKLRRAVLSAPNTDLQYAPAANFIRDLSEELYVSRSEAREVAGAVGAALADLLPGDELHDLRAELHDTFKTIFESAPAA